MCAAVFLNIRRAFDKLWYAGYYVYKIKNRLSSQNFLFFKSYPSNGRLIVKKEYGLSNIHVYDMNVSVTQDSSLEHLLYTLYLAANVSVTFCTYANDTTHIIATKLLRENSTKIERCINSINKN